jgi:CheY-like chemotaxis protein
MAIGDTGLGMGPAVLARAREPFFTTKQPGAGTGLGLPMANGYVEQCGGRLTIDSYAGAGTTVTLWLPEKPGGTAELPRADTAAFYDPARTLTRVLLVDDEAPIREVLAKHLEEAGYAVRVAANGVEALALLEPLEAVDAVITDLSMPGMDGLAVIQAVQDRCGAIPAILLTGYAEDAGALAMAGPFNGRVSLLRKPVREIQLLDRLGAMLAMRPSLSS